MALQFECTSFRVRPRTRTGGECSMACASSPSRRRGCTVPAHVRVTCQTGQCAAGTGTCTAVGKEGPAPTLYRRGPRAKQVRHTFVFDSYSRLQEASTARPALAVTPRCTERRTENAGGENLLVKARHAAIRPARVCAVHTCSARSGIRNRSSFWGASCYQASGSYPLKPD